MSVSLSSLSLHQNIKPHEALCPLKHIWGIWMLRDTLTQTRIQTVFQSHTQMLEHKNTYKNTCTCEHTHTICGQFVLMLFFGHSCKTSPLLGTFFVFFLSQIMQPGSFCRIPCLIFFFYFLYNCQTQNRYAISICPRREESLTPDSRHTFGLIVTKAWIKPPRWSCDKFKAF